MQEEEEKPYVSNRVALGFAGKGHSFFPVGNITLSAGAFLRLELPWLNNQSKQFDKMSKVQDYSEFCFNITELKIKCGGEWLI